MPDWSIESYSKIADGDSSITIFERNELGITWTTGPANPAVILSWILNDMQHPSKTVENTNDDNTANYSTSALGSSDYRVNVPRVYRLSSNPQLVKKSVAVNVNEQALVKDLYTFVKCCDLLQYIPRQESIVTLLGMSMGESCVNLYSSLWLFQCLFILIMNTWKDLLCGTTC